MEVAPSEDATWEEGDAARFTGQVSLRGTITADDGTNVGVVRFAAGARTHWHRHPGGQFLYCLEGSGRVRTRGEDGHNLRPGDVIHVGPAEWHFHGGSRDGSMTHVAVNGGGAPDWGDPVSDDEFDEGF
jgi:quercetin dioxygenase-like cupin family protein